uniref:Uncharacterized protein n=1 Tax=Anguilla anguilla TaxID=7936 RepID=A0A0E9SLM5_ANGAN
MATTRLSHFARKYIAMVAASC